MYLFKHHDLSNLATRNQDYEFLWRDFASDARGTDTMYRGPDHSDWLQQMEERDCYNAEAGQEIN